MNSPSRGPLGTRSPNTGGLTPSGSCSSPPGRTSARTQHYFDGGFIFPVTNNLQFDIRAGVGLSDASDDFFAGLGMVIRH